MSTSLNVQENEEQSIKPEEAETKYSGGHSGKAVLKALSGRAGMLMLDSATGILCARMLRPEGRGELSAMILWPVFLSQACTLGVPSAVIYSLRKHKQELGSLIAAAIVIGGIMSLITGTLGAIALPFWLTHYSSEMVHQAQWFMLASPLSMAALIFRGVWESEGSFGRSATAQLVNRLLTLSALFVLIATHNLTAITASYAYVLSGIPPFLWMCSSIVPKARWGFLKVKNAVKELLSYGLRSYGIDLCGALSQYIDQALVLGLLTAAEMGTYTVALSLSRMLNVISVSIAAVLFPKSVGRTASDSIRIAVRAGIGSIMMATVGAFLMIRFGGLALGLLYGKEYLVATSLLNVLVIEAILSGTITIMSQPFMAMGRPGTVTILQVSGLAISIPLISVLVPRYGSVGAAEALVCSACIRAVLLCICYQRTFPGEVRWSEVIGTESASIFRTVTKRLRGNEA